MPDVHVSARGELPSGPLRIVCHRRGFTVVSLVRALGHDERPEIHVEWPACSLVARDGGRLGLLEGEYDPAARRVRDPRYTSLSVPEAAALAPRVGELLVEEDARWGRVSVSMRLPELIRVGVLPGPRALRAVLDKLADRPELLLSLIVILRRHPEVVEAARDQVRAEVERTLAALSGERQRLHAAEAAHAAWTILGERQRALALLDSWRPASEHMQVNYLGADALALPEALVWAHLSRRDPSSDAARAFLKRHLLDPLANEIELQEQVELPGGFTTGLPDLDPDWIRRGRSAPGEAALLALVGQFHRWPRAGDALVSLGAGAWIDRMPMLGRRPPDPRGVHASLSLINPTAAAMPLAVREPSVRWRQDRPTQPPILRRVPPEVPPLSAMTVDLGVLGDERREPDAPFEVALTVAAGTAERRLVATGAVGVAW